MFGNRQGVIIWVHSLKHVKNLRRFGNIHYVSQRLKYIILYTNMQDVDRLVSKIQSYSYVKKVELSYKPFLKTEFENNSRRDEKEKEYDYKIGI